MDAAAVWWHRDDGLRADILVLQDETVVNGAQLFYGPQFGIGDRHSSRDTWLIGLVNSAPYLCCAFVGCWLTTPFNNWFGRRGTIWLTCFFSALACFWQAFTNSWWQ
jgi:MFS family permease